MTTKVNTGLINSASATNGQVLTADGSGNATFQDAAGGGSMVLLGSYTASNATSVDIGPGLDLDYTFNSTYDHYKLVMASVQSTTSATPYLRLSADGGSSFDAGSTHYDSAFISTGSNSTSNNSAANSTSNTFMRITGNTLVSGKEMNCVLDFFEIEALGSENVFHFHTSIDTSSSNLGVDIGACRRDNSGAFDAIRFLMSSGNIQTGKFYLYGISKS